MAMQHVRLELARTPDHPTGSMNCGYEFNMPLAEDGHIDLEEWKTRRSECTVRRFWEGEDDEVGHLIRSRNGWAFSYDPDTDEDDESVFRLEDHVFKSGEYVSITEHDGEQRTFRVVFVR
jgi:hypothetical protein